MVYHNRQQTLAILIKVDELFRATYSSLVTSSSAHACLTLIRPGVSGVGKSSADTLRDIPKL